MAIHALDLPSLQPIHTLFPTHNCHIITPSPTYTRFIPTNDEENEDYNKRATQQRMKIYIKKSRWVWAQGAQVSMWRVCPHTNDLPTTLS